MIAKDVSIIPVDGNLNNPPEWEVDWSECLMIGPNPGKTHGFDDLRLKYATRISSDIRNTIQQQLGYTSSSGIGHNKTLAKLVSSMNKPNKQTVIRDSCVTEFMETMKLNKIRGLGGKLGNILKEKFDADFASDLWKYSMQEIQQQIDSDPEKAQWIFNICRGVCTEPVVQKEHRKTLLGHKSFRNPLTVDSDVFSWALCFSSELFDRAIEEYELTKRWPKTISLVIESKGKITSTGVFPRKDLINAPLDLYNCARKLIRLERIVPCYGLSITLLNLDKAPKSITSYFTAISQLQLYEKTLSNFNPLNTNQFETNSNPHHISILEATDEEGVLLYYKCHECSKVITRASRQEHEDHHLALALAREPVEQIKKRKPPQKSAMPNGKSMKKQVSIRKFFVKK